MGFQSKLLIMLLAVSVLSVLIAGVLGYMSGTSSLRDAEFQRLTQLRESGHREISNYYVSIRNAAAVLTHSSATTTAVKEFTGAFADLQKAPLPPDAAATVNSYYTIVFGPELAKGLAEKVDP